MLHMKKNSTEEKHKSKMKVIEINQNIFEDEQQKAEEIRTRLKQQGTFLLNVMASPGAGKTSVLLRTIAMLKEKYRMGVMEADIDATVDAGKMEEAGVRSIQIHTGGECAMTAAMTARGMEEFPTEDLDLVFLENIGNLVCPAEEDVGASAGIEILSIPEGDDKPLKYPLMFQVIQAVLVNKIDTREYFEFDDEAFIRRVHALNPGIPIFFLSAKTGEGFEEWIRWLMERISDWKKADGQ